MAQVSISPPPRSRLVAAVALAGLLLIPRPGACDGAPALAAVPAEALAQSPPAEPKAAVSPPPSPSAPSKQWYGYQLMLADAASIGLIALAAPRRLDDISPIGVASLLLAPGIIHAIHGSWWKAGASPLLRVAIPATVGLLWYAANPCSPGQEFCGLDAIAFGGGLGMVTAMVIDYVWASKPVTATPVPEEKAISANRSINLHAAAALIGGGAKLVLGGSF
jgi:hypothetical protein